MSNVSNISYKFSPLIKPLLTSLLTSLLIVGCDNPSDSNAENDSGIQKKPQVDSEIQINLLQDDEIEAKFEPTLRDKATLKDEPKLTVKPVSPATNKLTCQQVDEKIAQDLKVSFKNSDYNRESKKPSNLKLVDKYNATIKATLTNYMQQAKSFQCQFPLASQQGLSIKTSSDNKFRTLSWDENTGGTMHNIAGFYQFKDSQGNLHLKDKHKSSIKKTQHSWPSALFTDTLNGKTTYMLVSTGVYSSKAQSQSLQAFTINGNKMLSAKIIRTNSLTNSLGFKYDFFSVVARPERPIQMFAYDKSSKTIRFPIIENDSEYPSGRVTGESIEYKFDGTHFQRVKN